VPRSASLVVRWAALPIALLCACGGGSSTSSPLPDQTVVEQAGAVELPAGVVAAEVVSALGTAPVVDGAFTVRRFAAGRQLVIAVSADGEPLLMGWLGPEHATLSARTTAEVLAWTATGAFTAPPALAPRVQDALAEAPELDPVADALSAALAAQPGGLTTPDAAVNDALTTATTALLAPEGPPRRGLPNGILVNPADEKSGIRLEQDTGFNSLTLVNRYRRPGFAFVDRVSYVEGDEEVPSPKEIARVAVPAVKGLEGGIGTLSQILNATQGTGGFSGSEEVAYVPRRLAPIDVPNVSGAKRTRYRVAVVGPGARDGDFSELTETEVGQQEQTTLSFVLKDVVLPIALNVLVPSSQLDEYLGHELAKSLVQDLGNLFTTQLPAFWERMRARDVRGAALVAVNALGSSASVRDVAFELIRERFYDLSTPEGDAAFARASTLAERYAAVTGALDLALTALDSLVIGAAIGDSAAAETWTVDVADGVVRLEPATTTLAPGDVVTLKAHVVDAGEGAVFEYRYSTAGVAGKLQGANAGGTAVTSSVDAITYDAVEPGEDVVTVDVYQIDLSARPYVGTAEATVVVEGSGLVVTPASPEVAPYGTETLTATLYGADVPDPLLVRWDIAGGGTLDGEVAVEATVTETNTHAVRFTAGFVPGDYTVTARMLRPATGPAPEVIVGEATTTVTVKPFAARITPLSSDIPAGGTQTLTATVTPAPPEGALTYTWAVASQEGLVDGEKSVTHTHAEATDTVVYQAVEEPTRCAQEVSLEVDFTVGEVTVSSPKTQATVRVDCPIEANLAITPSVIAPEATATATVTLDDAPEGATLRYRWRLTGVSSGALELPGGQPVGAAAVDSATVRYVAPNQVATDFVRVTVVSVGEGGEESELAEATAGVTTTTEDLYATGSVLFRDNEGSGCGAADFPEGVAVYYLFVCPDLGTPRLRVEIAHPAWVLPRWVSAEGAVYEPIPIPASSDAMEGPPFLEEHESITAIYGTPDAEHHDLLHRHLAGCNPPAWREAMQVLMGSVATITCVGTYEVE